MITLEEVYAGRGDVYIISALEIVHGETALRLVDGWQDLQLGKDGSGVDLELFKASDIELTMPSSNNSGSQNINIAVQSVDHTLQDLVENAVLAGSTVKVKISFYLDVDLTKPASAVITGVLKDVNHSYNDDVVNLRVSFFDIININFNRTYYDSATTPLIMYL